MARDIEEIKDRIAGCLWGQAIGDALGLGTEFMSRTEVMNWYPEGLERYEQIISDWHRSRWEKGEWTDDTDMMLCIARAIIADKTINPKTVAHNFKEWFRGTPMGIGQLTYTVLGLYDYEADPEKAAEIVWDMYGRKNAANGGVMRTSIVGLWNEDVAVNAEKICKLTHADPRCIGSCVIISELINSLVWQGAYSGARSASNSSLKRSKRCSLTYKKQVKYEQKMQKSSGRTLIFRSIVGQHSISARRRHFRHIHSGV